MGLEKNMIFVYFSSCWCGVVIVDNKANCNCQLELKISTQKGVRVGVGNSDILIL